MLGNSVDTAMTEEQQQLRSSVRHFLGQHAPEAEVRRLMDTERGYEPSVWLRMATELGLQGLVIPQEHGGSGASWGELGLVLEEMGRSLLCAPFYSTVVLAATAVMESDDDAAQAAVLPRIADGTMIATVALVEDGGPRDPSRTTVEARRTRGGFALTGSSAHVIDGHVADLIIVPAVSEDGPTLFMVNGDAEGLTKLPCRPLDLTRKLATLEFADVSATPLGAVGSGADILERTLDLAMVGLAAEQVGGSQSALDLAVEYAKDRIQFGQPIGSFQAIKHMCADMLLEVESARSAAYYALGEASERSAELPAAASLAKAYCSEAYAYVSHESIQIHGGIGFTWECAAHLYYKRAKSMYLYLGDPIHHREQLVRRSEFLARSTREVRT